MGRKIKDTFAVLFLLATLLFVIKFNDINITVFSDEIGNKNDTQVSVIPNTDKGNHKEPMSEEMDIPSEDMTEGVLEDTTENATESTTENSTESTQEDMSEDTSESITDNTQDNTTDKLPDNNTENITETVPEYTPENIISSTTSLVEDDIYSFFQGEQAWWAQRTWSGEWAIRDIDGNVFSDFGCGLCCMANIYDTLSPYEVSPWDMLLYAKTASRYYPTGSVGAISWKDIKTTLLTCGITCELYNKPYTYAQFQEYIKNATSALVLVCSYNDNTYWETTGGHYVTIWMYDEATDTVFLSDPGRFTRNRQRIPLIYVYNALKTGSSYQYLLVGDYSEEQNAWKGNGTTDNWIRP